MSEWLVKRGNTAILDVLIKDNDGAPITTLAAVTEAIFQVKETKDSTTKKIEITLGDGVEVNTPSEGYVRLILVPVQTDLPVKKYFMGLQLKWSDSELLETDIHIDGVETDQFRVKQEVII